MEDPKSYFVGKAKSYYLSLDDSTVLLEECLGPKDDIIDIIDHMLSIYNISDPAIDNWGSYHRSLIKKRGLRANDLGRLISKTPELDVSTLTLGELCDAARRGYWIKPVADRLIG